MVCETAKGRGGRYDDPVREVLLKLGLWQVNSISPRASILEAITLMNKRDVGALVVTEGERLVAVISERDCSRRLLLEGRDPATTAVGDVMSTVVCSVTANKEVSECIELMLRRHIRHLPVLFGSCLVGCVSLRNLMEYVFGVGREEVGEAHEGRRPAAQRK